jgi:hypothetical protein
VRDEASLSLSCFPWREDTGREFPSIDIEERDSYRESLGLVLQCVLSLDHSLLVTLMESNELRLEVDTTNNLAFIDWHLQEAITCPLVCVIDADLILH